MVDSGGASRGAWALLEEDGRLRPSAAFQELLGPLPSRLYSTPAELLGAAGFRQVEGTWQRGEERLLLHTEPVPGGRLLRVAPAAPAEREVRLLRIAAHDVRGPLANVRSYVGLLLGGRYSLEPKVERSLHVVRRNADKALALVEDTIDSLRLDRGGLPVEPGAVPLRPAMEKALQRSEDRAEPSPAEREVHLPEEAVEVWAEPDRLVRVVYAPLEHLLLRAAPGARLTLEVAGDPEHVEVRYLLQPGTGVSPHPFARDERVLEEHKLEDPVRMDVARRLAECWGGGLTQVESAGGAAQGFTLRLRRPQSGTSGGTLR